MRISGKVVAITGGGSGLGAALAKLARGRGAREIAVLDLNGEAAQAVAREVDGTGYGVDVGNEPQLRDVLQTIEATTGGIDLFISNAGIGRATDPFAADDAWQRCWQVNVMSNVYAARILLPAMLKRGSGHLAATASVNSLISNPGDMGYAVTKNAQLAVAEWLAMTYGGSGIKVTAFCPSSILTPMLLKNAETNSYARSTISKAMSPEDAATIMLNAIEGDMFIVGTNPTAFEEFRMKANDYEAWLDHARERRQQVAPHVGLPSAS